jgi:hypothetical protein
MPLSNIKKQLESIGYDEDVENIFIGSKTGYWSNLERSDNQRFIQSVKSDGPKTAVEKYIPQYRDMIFNCRREAALELLDHTSIGTCIDYGCMWGVMSIGMAKRGHTVLALDQTYESLQFLNERAKLESKISIIPVNVDVRRFNFPNFADYALVNGVLEWVPEDSNVVVDNFYKGKYDGQNSKSILSPKDIQLDFLKNVCKNLKQDGTMLLAIENRFNYEYFIGKRDPHVNLLFTTFLPRPISNIISKIFRRREYKNYIYSPNELKKLVFEAGFSNIEEFICFPDYHFPALILPNTDLGIKLYDLYENNNRKTFKQKLAFRIEILLMKYFKARNYSPALIILAKK